jgi:HEAT repeat protein
MIHLRRIPIALAILLATAATPGLLPAQNSELPLATGQNLQEEVAKLTAVLKSDAELFEKAIACKRLSVIGTKDAVPVLASLLSDEKLAHYARYGLEPIPDPAVDAAFRGALTKLRGGLLVGVINSIGNRKDEAATDALVGLMGNSDQEIAKAAAAALGRIGNAKAAETLLKGLAGAQEPLRTAFADASLACAEGLSARGRREDALAIYDTLGKLDLPKHIHEAAAHWSILARGADGIDLLVKHLKADDKEMFAVGLRTAHLLPGDDVTRRLAAQLDGLSPDRKSLLLQVLVRRGGEVARQAVLEAATSGDVQVRIAAIRGLEKLGDASSVPLLLDAITSGDEELIQAGKTSLAGLKDPRVDAAVVTALERADSPLRPLAIEMAGLRRVAAAAPALLEAADDPDEKIRLAAIKSLGTTIGLDGLSGLAARIVTPKTDQDAAAAREALYAACIRVADSDACAAKLASCLGDGPPEVKSYLFELLKTVGGAKALALVVDAAKSDDAQMQDLATKVLGEWMSPDAAPALIELAQTLADEKFKVRAMRAYIRIPRQLNLPADEKLAMCREAMRVAWRVDEKKVVLDVLKSDRNPSPASLAMALESIRDSALKGPATAAAVMIAEKIARTHPAAVIEAMQTVLGAGARGEMANRAKVISDQAKRAAGK